MLWFRVQKILVFEVDGLWWSIFSLNCQNAYGHQTFQGSDMRRGAVTHKYPWHLNGVVLLGHVTNKIHISTCRRFIETTTDIVLEAPKHDPSIKRTTWGHVIVWKMHISIFMRFIANKLGRLLTLGRIFIAQMLKSSPSSCSPSRQEFGRTDKICFPLFVELLLWVRVNRIGVNNMICSVLSTHVL